VVLKTAAVGNACHLSWHVAQLGERVSGLNPLNVDWKITVHFSESRIWFCGTRELKC